MIVHVFHFNIETKNVVGSLSNHSNFDENVTWKFKWIRAIQTLSYLKNPFCPTCQTLANFSEVEF